MMEHHWRSLLSMPSNSRNADNARKAIEDKHAGFVFKFISFKHCAYLEFYLIDGGVGGKESDSGSQMERMWFCFPSTIQIHRLEYGKDDFIIICYN